MAPRLCGKYVHKLDTAHGPANTGYKPPWRLNFILW
jgi:hypothetical protein